MKVEFANGGPADGHVREIDGTPETILVYGLTDPPGKWELERPEGQPRMETHVYRSSSRLTKDAATIFDYRGKVRP